MDKDCMLLFDLDGTLWDSSARVAESWNIIMGRERFCADDIRSVMGMTMEEIARTLEPDMDPSLRDPLFHRCEAYEVTYIEEHGGELYPQVTETLKELRRMGYSMAVVSNCQEGYVRAFLTSMQMQLFFCDYEEWGRTGKSKAENIRLVMERNGFRQAVYVGDTRKDQEASAEAGVPFLWASYGFGSVSDYMAKLGSFQELPGVLRHLSPQDTYVKGNG